MTQSDASWEFWKLSEKITYLTQQLAEAQAKLKYTATKLGQKHRQFLHYENAHSELLAEKKVDAAKLVVLQAERDALQKRVDDCIEQITHLKNAYQKRDEPFKSGIFEGLLKTLTPPTEGSGDLPSKTTK